MPLEGLWWTEPMSQFTMENKDMWQWTAMIMQPEYVTEELFNRAVEQVQIKKIYPFENKVQKPVTGLSTQLMYIVHILVDGPTIEKLHNFIEENGYELRGKHHEIYLSDPRRSAPENLENGNKAARYECRTMIDDVRGIIGKRNIFFA